MLAHLAFGGSGKSTKGCDLNSAYACFYCHSVIDGHIKPPPELTKEDILESMIRGRAETMSKLVETGIVVVKP